MNVPALSAPGSAIYDSGISAKAGRAFTKHPIQVLENELAHVAACADVGHARDDGWVTVETEVGGDDEEHAAKRSAIVRSAQSGRIPALTEEF